MEEDEIHDIEEILYDATGQSYAYSRLAYPRGSYIKNSKPIRLPFVVDPAELVSELHEALPTESLPAVKPWTRALHHLRGFATTEEDIEVDN